MDSLVCVGIKSHGLILITDFEDRIFDGPIVETERNLLQIAPAACSIAVIQVGVYSVVPDDSGEGRSLAKPARGEFGQERWHEMIVALDIETFIRCGGMLGPLLPPMPVRSWPGEKGPGGEGIVFPEIAREFPLE